MKDNSNTSIVIGELIKRELISQLLKVDFFKIYSDALKKKI